MLNRYYVWRSFRRETTVEIVHAETMLVARLLYARDHCIPLREAEAEQA